jgi:integrase
VAGTIFMYLYQYKQSKKFYFRIRLRSLGVVDQTPSNCYFIRSLRTEDRDIAQGIAAFMKTAIEAKLKRYKYENALSAEPLNSLSVTPILNLEFQCLLNSAYEHIERYGDASELSLDSLKLDISSTQKDNVPTEMPCKMTSDEHITNNTLSLSSVSEKTLLFQLVSDVQLLQEKLGQHTEVLQKLLNGTRTSIVKSTDSELQTDTTPSNRTIYEPAFSLKTQFALFMEEQSNSIKKRTTVSYLAKFNFLFSVISSGMDCRQFNKIHMQNVKSALIKKQTTRGIKQQGLRITTKTINHYLSHYRAFFTWLNKNVDGMHSNPFANVTVKTNNIQSSRRAFTNQEIKTILSYRVKHPVEAKRFRDDARWFLPIALYTGMRLNEIAELRLADIKKIDDAWCLDLREHDTKNASSKRVVPIAQRLLDLGFLEYVDTLRQNETDVLFYQIRKGKRKPSKDGWGEPISRWFNRTVCKKIGIEKESANASKANVVFHCFRHTMINTCITNGAQKHLIKRIVGHAQDDRITLGVYSNVQHISLTILKAELDKHLVW